MSQAGISSIRAIPSIALQFTTDSGIAVPAANNVNILGGVGASTSADGLSTITITVDTASFDWSEVTSATNPNSLVKQNGYISKGAGVVTFLLPASAAIGDTFIIAGYGNLWTLTQNAGQSVTFGSSTSSVGAGGSVTATNTRDSITIVCVTTDTEFQIISGVGNLTMV